MTTERSVMSLDQVSADINWEASVTEFSEVPSAKMFAWKNAIDAHLAARNAVVSDESWRPVVSKVLTALDIATGDTDPNIDPDMTDDEVRDEYPEIWAMQKLSLLLANQPESLASRKVAVPDGWKLVPIEPTLEMLRAADRLPDNFSLGDEWEAMLNSVPADQSMLASQDEVK